MKKIIYSLSKGFFYAFCMFFLFVFIFSLLAFVEHSFGWDIPLIDINGEKESVFIRIPFTKMGISIVFHVLAFVGMCLGLLFYVVYFYVLKEFFGVFIKKDLFNTDTLERLKRFYQLNFVPLAYALLLSGERMWRTGQSKLEEDQFLAIFHLLIALSIYLYMDIVKRGKVIQDENDLTI